MPRKSKGLTVIHAGILEELKRAPDGLDIDEIRQRVHFRGNQQHLDKRVRELYPFHIIERTRQGRRFVYRYLEERTPGTWEYEKISKTLRARILHRDGERCRMCGRTVAQDLVRLHIDHKIPAHWGGLTIPENLWSLCSACNEGKKNYFASFNDDLMTEILGISCVHRRIAMLLHAKAPEWVDSDLIEFVANFNDYQDDWQKRLRELRYTGLEIPMKREKEEKRTKSFYKVTNWVELPDDIGAFVTAYEKERAMRNRTNREAQKP